MLRCNKTYIVLQRNSCMEKTYSMTIGQDDSEREQESELEGNELTVEEIVSNFREYVESMNPNDSQEFSISRNKNG